jgi:hypothetical protein
MGAAPPSFVKTVTVSKVTKLLESLLRLVMKFPSLAALKTFTSKRQT